MITNIGSIGLDQAYVPLVPYSRVPILIALGAVSPGFLWGKEPRWKALRLALMKDPDPKEWGQAD